jgi:uncharacterized membrane protein YeaQ/YmgE (transglycosylase-associated protein family)
MALGLGAVGVLLLLTFVLIGLSVGALARFLLPGPDPMSLPATAGFGIAGSLVGGIIGRLGAGALPGYVLSVGGAMLLIWFFKRRGQRPSGGSPTAGT